MQTHNKENSNRKPVILFADDDELCLDVGVQILQKLGYSVLRARDGQEALEVFKNNKNSVDLVILDMRMPYNGGRAFDQLKQIKSDVKVLIASGYTEDQQIRDMFEQGCIGFIQKPFNVNVLSNKILKALKN
ncbi:MAG: response regulator [Deltaproteobacteria bacterium]|jgi:CheY-like chemotaxis protein|nr:response regulator [Deltaproteobacteria bacterium]